MIKIIKNLLLLHLLGIMLYSCSSSELVSTWKDEEFIKENKFEKLLVIALGERKDSQKLFENLFKKNFEEENVEAIKSYPLLGLDKKLIRDEIMSIVSEQKIDGVLITHLKDTETEITYSPNTQSTMSGSNMGSMYTYYQTTYDYLHAASSTQQKVKVMLETRLFDVKEERVVWSTVSATIDPNDVRKAIEEIQKLIIDQMKEDNVI